MIGDLDAVERLEQAVFAMDDLSRRSLRYYIQAPSAVFLVLEQDHAIIGDAIVAFRRGTTIARLYSIAVAPGQGGRGLGRRLLDACEDVARSWHVKVLRLEVRSDNDAAIRFYDAAGYRRFGIYPEYYEDGATAIRYERNLS